MIINGENVTAKEFAYDECHKIYILETDEDRHMAQEFGYDILPIESIKQVYEGSCPLRFISNWSLDTQYVPQGVKARFIR